MDNGGPVDHTEPNVSTEGPAGDPSGVVVVPCRDLDTAIDGYRAVGFQLRAIGPADDPTWAELAIPGVTLVLDGAAPEPEAGPFIKVFDHHRPDNTPPEVLVAAVQPPIIIPDVDQRLVISHETAAGWNTGRAGMLYRDLLPDRHGGAFIASHIHIPNGGPVPDYVHFHDVAFQMIFCHRGWVRVVYQDQGPPFVMEPGDCVLQPPGIRHRVLEASDDLYVVEISCPAAHRTNLDNDMELPNVRLEPNRSFGGQRFVRHVSTDVAAHRRTGEAMHIDDTAISAATGGMASARVLTASEAVDDPWPLAHDRDLFLLFVLSGEATLADPDGRTERLGEGSSVAIPSADAAGAAGAAGADTGYALTGLSAGTALLEVTCSVPDEPPR